MFKKLFFLIVIFGIICICYEYNNSIADDNWSISGGMPEEIGEAEEIELGKKVDEFISHQFYIDKDPELNKVINDIAQKIFTVSERKTLPFRCNILQSHSVNAFSSPGGHIYITYGLLEFTKTKDEVAGIIGHEVAHASLMHVSKLYHEINELVSHQEKKADSVIGFLLLNSHLEEFEHEADIAGALYAYKAGFDPNGLPDFLERHLIFTAHNGPINFRSFDVYKSIDARIHHLREYVSSLEDHQKDR
ncbi:MAG: M48 family metalloprotease [Candidatus Brocadiaceae bacterium]|nr:M48 family metalloprotease [Candidatus Brocadiaceae bacterium]